MTLSRRQIGDGPSELTRLQRENERLSNPIPWRTVETALVAALRETSDGDITVGPLSADTWLTFACNDDPHAHQINLTSLAKSLTDRLNEGKP